MTRSGPRIVQPPSDPCPTSRAVPYRPTTTTWDTTGRPSTSTQVRSKRLPSPARPPVMTAEPPVPSVSPSARVLPLTSMPSPRTNTAARSSPRSRSRLPSVRPTSAESDLITGSASTASTVRSKRATATVRDSSYTDASRISPDVEQPITAERGNASTTARRGASSSSRSGLPKTRTRVPGPSQAGRGVDQPVVRFQPAVSRSIPNPSYDDPGLLIPGG